MPPTPVSRRQVLKASAAGAAFSIIPASTMGRAHAAPPSERVTLGLIGCGGHGAGWNLAQVFRNTDSEVIAVSDCDRQRQGAAQKKVAGHYRAVLGDRFRGCDAHNDFRDLIARKDIDAIVNCTPDHWHVIPSLMAARAGKDVICEKPLTLTVKEGQVLCKVVAEERRIFQTASENRSIDTYIHLCECVRSGRIGKLQHIDVSLPVGNRMRGPGFDIREVRPVPEHLDYDMWLGQAPKRPYVPARVHGSFRWHFDYSGGVFTDWGAHMIDLAQWGSDHQHTGPVEVQAEGHFPPEDSVFNTPDTFTASFRYADGVTMEVTTRGPSIRFVGEDGWIGFRGWRGPLAAHDREIVETPISDDEVKLYRPDTIIARTDGKGGEHRNFIDCVKSRTPCYAPAEIGHRTITCAHIGNISMRLGGRKLKWNPDEETFEGDDEANAMLSREMRKPWTLDV